MNNIQLHQMDLAFDAYTVYPVISTVSGAARSLYGLAELITGIFQTIFYGIKQFDLNLTDENQIRTNSHNLTQGCLHIFFGGSSIIKGAVEAIPLVNFSVADHNVRSRKPKKGDLSYNDRLAWMVEMPIAEARLTS